MWTGFAFTRYVTSENAVLAASLSRRGGAYAVSRAPSSLPNFTNSPPGLFADGPKAFYDPVVLCGESFQRNERVFVSHLGKRVSTPEPDFLGWVAEIN